MNLGVGATATSGSGSGSGGGKQYVVLKLEEMAVVSEYARPALTPLTLCSFKSHAPLITPRPPSLPSPSRSTESIYFGKYKEPHPCNLKDFKVYGYCGPSSDPDPDPNSGLWTKLLRAGLRDNGVPEEFALDWKDGSGLVSAWVDDRAGCRENVRRNELLADPSCLFRRPAASAEVYQGGSTGGPFAEIQLVDMAHCPQGCVGQSADQPGRARV